MFPDFEEKNNLSFKGKEMVLFVYVVFNIDSNVIPEKKSVKKLFFCFSLGANKICSGQKKT